MTTGKPARALTGPCLAGILLSAGTGLLIPGTGLTPNPAAAACLDYSAYLHHPASITLPGTSARRVATNGELVVLARGSIGIHVLSVADPANPVLLGSLDTPGACSDVRLYGQYAYVSDGTSGLQIVDLSNPATPAIVGNWDPGSVSAFDIEGTRLAILGTGGFHLLDITNPLAPAVLGTGAAPTSALDVALEGARAYLAGSDGLRIVDLANPAAPTVAGFIAASGSGDIVGVEAAGNVVHFVDNPANFELGLWRIFDVSNPALPALLAQRGFYYAFDLAIDGDMACVLSYSSGPFFFDISDLSDPVQVVVVSAMLPSRVVMAGGACYMDGQGQFDIVTTPSLDPPPTIGLVGAGAWDVRVVGDHMVSVGDDGFHTWSLANPEVPAPLATRSVDGVGLDIAGSLAAVARGTLGLQLVDVANLAAPIVRGLADTPGFAGDVALYGSYAYVADGNAGVSVVSVASPLSPWVITTIPTGGEVLGVTVDGARLYVADVDQGLFLFDLTNPASPQPLGSLELSGAGSVVIDGTRAYVAAYGRFYVVDVSDPMAPSLIGAGLAGNSQHALLLDDDRVYLGGQQGIFFLFDVSDPTQPHEIGRQFLQGEATGLGAYQDVIYAADPDAGIHVLPRACVSTTGVPDARPISTGLIIHAAFPNPFHERIEFVIGGAGASGGAATEMSAPLRASILDVTGRLVRHLPVPTGGSDEYHLAWDGRDDAGRITPAGVYFLRVNDAQSLETRRFVRMR